MVKHRQHRHYGGDVTIRCPVCDRVLGALLLARPGVRPHAGGGGCGDTLKFLTTVRKRPGTITDAGSPQFRVRLRCLNKSCCYERVVTGQRFWNETTRAMSNRIQDIRFE